MRTVTPLGEQIIIRTIPQQSVGSIIVPDSAKQLTKQGDDGQAVHFVEAEVIAVGPGKRGKGDETLIEDLVRKLDQLAMHDQGAVEETQALIDRAARNGHQRQSLSVKPGDRIVFHPAVQSFDRDITDFMADGSEEVGTKYYLISEERSALAVIERNGVSS